MVEGLADALYSGKPDAAPTSPTQTPGQAEHAALAANLYDKAAEPSKAISSELWDNDSAVVRNAIRERVEGQIDTGVIDPAEADEIVLGLSREVESLGLENEDYFLREVMRPADADSGRARGTANRWLREQYGDKAPQVLQAANRWLGSKAPGIAKMLSLSRAGNDVQAIQSVIRAYEKAQRSGR
jgi:hypothetical protein